MWRIRILLGLLVSCYDIVESLGSLLQVAGVQWLLCLLVALPAQLVSDVTSWPGYADGLPGMPDLPGLRVEMLPRASTSTGYVPGIVGKYY